MLRCTIIAIVQKPIVGNVCAVAVRAGSVRAGNAHAENGSAGFTDRSRAGRVDPNANRALFCGRPLPSSYKPQHCSYVRASLGWFLGTATAVMAGVTHSCCWFEQAVYCGSILLKIERTFLQVVQRNDFQCGFMGRSQYDSRRDAVFECLTPARSA